MSTPVIHNKLNKIHYDQDYHYDYINIPIARPDNDHTDNGINSLLNPQLTLSNSVFDEGRKYQVAVEYIALYLDNVPLLIGKDNTPVYVGLVHNNILYEQKIVWEPEDGLTINGEQFLYTRQAIANSINTAIANAGAALNTAVPGTIPGAPDVPLLLWDESDQKFKFTVLASIAGTVEFVVDAFLFNRIFNSFSYKTDLSLVFTNTSPVYTISIGARYNNSVSTRLGANTGAPFNYFIMKSEYVNEHSLTEINGLRLKSAAIGVKPEYSLSALQWRGGQGSSATAPQNVIQELTLDLSASNDARGKALYLPSIYAWHDITKFGSIKDFSFSLTWLDNQNNERDFIVPIGKTVSFKFIFRRKKEFD